MKRAAARSYDVATRVAAGSQLRRRAGDELPALGVVPTAQRLVPVAKRVNGNPRAA
jgi:hypothetical protein